MKDWRELRLMMINLFTYDTQPKVAHILDEIGRTLSAYIQGLGKLSLIAGASHVGVAILGIQFPLVFGFLAVMAETVPVVGPLMGAVPAVFIAYSQNTSSAFSVALFYLVFYQIDGNILIPGSWAVKSTSSRSFDFEPADRCQAVRYFGYALCRAGGCCIPGLV